MFIESQDALKQIEGKLNNSIVIPMYKNDVQHVSKEFNICLLYIRSNEDSYTISIDHPESIFNVEWKLIRKMFKNKTIYTDDKKSLLDYLDCDIKDVNLMKWFDTNTPMSSDNITTTAHEFYKSKYWQIGEVNKLIPIMKHIECASKIADMCSDVIQSSNNVLNLESYNTYNDLVIPTLQSIESNGLCTTTGDCVEFTQYNPYTSTGRPSNRFAGINYAALNKEDGSRERFISRFKDGKLIEMDFDAYHLRLIATVLKYKLPNASVHEYLGKQYFGKDTLTKEEYNESKEISFRILYGGVPKEFQQIEFFSKVHNFIKQLWSNFKSKGVINTYLFDRPMYKRNFSDMNPQKLFNYYIQALETESNIMILAEIRKVMHKYRSKIVLYTYDSFLFDFDSQDDEIFIKDVLDVIEYPVTVKNGTDYNNMMESKYGIKK